MKPLLSLICLFTLAACNQSDSNIKFKYHKDIFIKSAHYFSSAWPKTFWQEFEEGNVDKELKQIKADGFNTVVLTVPWRGFETDFGSKRTESNEFLYQRLTFVIESIIDNQMLFMLRVGFPHDYTQNTGTDIMQQCIGIYSEEGMQAHWQKYLNKVKKTIQRYDAASAGILVSWEDWWCPHFVLPRQTHETRIEMAQKLGYGNWLKQQNNNIVKVLLQSDDVNFEQVSIPQPGDLSYVLYLDFIDQLIDQKILKPTQTIFPNTALEIRVDKLPVKQGDQYTWIGHNLYLDEKNHRGTYWAPFWGAQNNGELLSAEQALKNFEYFLKLVSGEGKNINHVIEQFNFYDNTPYFPNNANIKPAEIAQFLISAGPLLKQYAQGVGVWAYKDYLDNGLYNASFEMGLDGWETSGNVQLKQNTGDQQLSMAVNSTITQSVDAEDRFMLVHTYETLDFCLKSDRQAQLKISINGTAQRTVDLQSGYNCTEITASPFKQKEPTTLTITANDAVTIDELSLHGFTQVLGLYHPDGTEGPYLPAYRQLNNFFN
ncbi:MAG: hypothetical protein KDI92_03800 [Xanthomonadales bacterium]|nr:hypothetical protein [Xanthomonadales bacterium]